MDLLDVFAHNFVKNHSFFTIIHYYGSKYHSESISDENTPDTRCLIGSNVTIFITNVIIGERRVVNSIHMKPGGCFCTKLCQKSFICSPQYAIIGQNFTLSPVVVSQMPKVNHLVYYSIVASNVTVGVKKGGPMILVRTLYQKLSCYHFQNFQGRHI